MNIIISSAVLAALISGLIWFQIHRYNSIRVASANFRNVVLTELEGIYPTTLLLANDINIRLRQSLQKIETASAEFRHFLLFYRKRAFDAALKNYRDTCNKIDWNHHVAFGMFPSMHKPGEIDPKQYFFQCVNKLLKFAK